MLEVTPRQGRLRRLTYEIAETKVAQVTTTPGSNQHPLLCTMKRLKPCLSSELEICLNTLSSQPGGAPRIHDGRAPAARHHRHAESARDPRACGADATACARNSPSSSSRRLPGFKQDDGPARCSRRLDSSACCSAPCSTCSRAQERSPSPTCWWRSSAKSTRTRRTCSRCRTCRASTSSLHFPRLPKTGDDREARPMSRAGGAKREARAARRSRSTHQPQPARERGRIDPYRRRLEVERTIEISAAPQDNPL